MGNSYAVTNWIGNYTLIISLTTPQNTVMSINPLIGNNLVFTVMSKEVLFLTNGERINVGLRFANPTYSTD